MGTPIKVKAIVKSISSYGNQVYKVVLIGEKKFPRFKAGQFLHLTLEGFDPTTGFWPESRVFSIANCSADRSEVTIVYSVKGIYTRKMEKELKEGGSVWLKAPYGEFIIANHIKDGETAVLIAGGTGVSPFIPFLEDLPDSIKVNLYYGLRNIDLMIFETEISSIVNNANIEINFYLEQPAVKLPISGNIQVKNGQLSVQNILDDTEDKDKSKFFISGPPAMIINFKKQLLDLNISDKNIIIDKWG